MKTGYYAKLKTYISLGYVPVSIAGKCPDWYDGLEYKVLAPKYNFFVEWKYGAHKGDNEYYVDQFNKCVLNGLNRDSVIGELENLAGVTHDKIILLCYEKPTDFCHRHLVAEWLGSDICDEINT